MSLPSVSVVIPTAGRETIVAAVSSVLRQTLAPVEIIVVIDSQDGRIPPALEEISDAVRMVSTGGIGANGARMRGAAEAKGDVIAFLDDDDVWAPEKLERQMTFWESASGTCNYTLASCRVAVIDANGTLQRTLPSRLMQAHQRVAEYLFRRTTVAYGEGLLHTSTLMCDRRLIEIEPWDLSLSRHQDWDWVLRVSTRQDVAFRMCPEVLVGVTVADTRSISMSGDWRASLNWLEQHRDRLSARERGDFLLSHTAPIAIRAGSRQGGLVAAWRGLTSGRPGFAAWLVWGLHMISPQFVDNVAILTRRLHGGRPEVWSGWDPHGQVVQADNQFR
jgi:glycosyltransferase involved in cell wall biosynthesis